MLYLSEASLFCHHSLLTIADVSSVSSMLIPLTRGDRTHTIQSNVLCRHPQHLKCPSRPHPIHIQRHRPMLRIALGRISYPQRRQIQPHGSLSSHTHHRWSIDGCILDTIMDHARVLSHVRAADAGVFGVSVYTACGAGQRSR